MCWCYLGPGRLAVLERWLPNTVTILDRFHCMNVSIVHPHTESILVYREFSVCCTCVCAADVSVCLYYCASVSFRVHVQ